MITLDHVLYRIDQRAIIDDVSFTFEDKQFYGLIGPNGTGKSTLIQLMTGIIKAEKGSIQIDNKDVKAYRTKQLARKIAVLQQGGLEPLGYKVAEVLAMARYPHQHVLKGDQANSEHIIKEAVERTNITNLLDSRLDELSGGERQRVALAKLWVQRPHILLLDEPTTYLDIGYQQMVMEFIANWQREEQLLVVAVMHDINLAALYCDQIVALKDGKIIATGVTNEILTEQLMSELFAAQIEMIDHPHLHVPQMIMSHKQ